MTADNSHAERKILARRAADKQREKDNGTT
jgi:hypothetical protein